jgi:hypothetical protein
MSGDPPAKEKDISTLFLFILLNVDNFIIRIEGGGGAVIGI